MFRSYAGLKVMQVANGSTTTTINVTSNGKNPTGYANGVTMFNDSGADITIVINALSIVIKTGEMFDEVFEPFKTIGVTATGAYRCLIKW